MFLASGDAFTAQMASGARLYHGANRRALRFTPAGITSW
jgi:hypothetical protein